MILFADIVTAALSFYLLGGVLFAVPFVLRGVNRIDPVAREGTWGFRLLILPGVVALWPLLLGRWVRGEGPPQEKNAHRRAAKRGPR